ELGRTPRQHLVHIRLMADVPDQHILRRLENSMQGDRQLDDTEVRPQVPPGTRHRVHQLGTDVRSEPGEIVRAHMPQILGAAHGRQERTRYPYRLLPTHGPTPALVARFLRDGRSFLTVVTSFAAPSPLGLDSALVARFLRDGRSFLTVVTSFAAPSPLMTRPPRGSTLEATTWSPPRPAARTRSAPCSSRNAGRCLARMSSSRCRRSAPGTSTHSRRPSDSTVAVNPSASTTGSPMPCTKSRSCPRGSRGTAASGSAATASGARRRMPS